MNHFCVDNTYFSFSISLEFNFVAFACLQRMPYSLKDCRSLLLCAVFEMTFQTGIYTNKNRDSLNLPCFKIFFTRRKQMEPGFILSVIFDLFITWECLVNTNWRYNICKFLPTFYQSRNSPMIAFSWDGAGRHDPGHTQCSISCAAWGTFEHLLLITRSSSEPLAFFF